MLERGTQKPKDKKLLIKPGGIVRDTEENVAWVFLIHISAFMYKSLYFSHSTKQEVCRHAYTNCSVYFTYCHCY